VDHVKGGLLAGPLEEDDGRWQEESVSIISRGFRGRRRDDDGRVPPGQYLTRDFPVLSAGPTPHIPQDRWTFKIRTESGASHQWSWAELTGLPAETVTVDIHCVTRWTKLETVWRGVSLDTFFAEVETAADFALVHSYGGYTTNLPLADLIDGHAWVAFEFDHEGLAPEHGGPARLLVPHLYFWKSAKWVHGIDLLMQDEPGFWEQLGYHDYGDPWREQRYQGD
jgi:DMSO/TMAO reductase YedYZ molybdopterin-dependent catalytic subunit